MTANGGDRMTGARRQGGGDVSIPRSTRIGEKRTAALALVFVVLAAAFLPLISDDSGSYGYQGDSTVITYHYSQDSDQTLKVTYYGTPVAEYNPEFWSGNISGDVAGGGDKVANWIGPKCDVDITNYTIAIHISGSGTTEIQLPDVDCQTSFTSGHGQVEFNNDTNVLRVQHSGYVVLSLTVSKLHTNMVFGGWKESDNSGIIDPGHTDFSSDGVDLYANWIVPNVYNQSGVGRVDISDNHYDLSGLILPYLPNGGSYYAEQSTSNRDVDQKYANIVKFSSNTNSLTIREGTYRSVDVDDRITLDVSNNLTLGGDVILDNVKLIGNGGTEGSPTTQTNTGIFANGYQLILGTGIEFAGDASKPQNVQVYGGTSTGGSHDNGTDVRVFSGKYSNFIGGTASGDTGIKSTHLVIVGNTEVLESVIGGNINSDLGSSGSNDGKAEVIVAGNAYIFSKNYADKGYKVVPGVSTVIGGCRISDLYGSSHVTVTGNAKVFAVQGGGRQATTYVDQTNVTISGKAQVNMVCGSVTDGGVDEDGGIPVDTTHVTVKDSALVGSAYGGGWDMYAEPLNESAEYTNVTIEDSPVIGAVFGGGFRGSIGSGDSETVRLTITGGTIGAVYGGGQGGLDPNSNSTDESSANTTGRAYVVGGVVMEITGGTIDSSSFSFTDRVMKVSSEQTIDFWLDPEIASGNVYGGGYGAAKAINDTRGVNDCAKVTGDIRLTIGGTAVVNGSVYGGGKGTPISDDPLGDGSVAVVQGSVNINIYGGEVKGSLFGAGEYGSLDVGNDYSAPADITITVENAIVGEDIFGGGLGEDGRLSAYTMNRTITLNGAEVGGSVFGGSRLGYDNCFISKDENNLGILEKKTLSSNTELRVVSVDMTGGGNIYGGGYMGYSFMDTHVLVGSSAADASGISNPKGFINIDSIYGGSSIGESTGTTSGTELLLGSTYVEISLKADHNYQGVWIAGDVFGAGDYCEITGSSEILFDGFSQSSSMLSIQKADLVTLVGSSLTLDGNIDGSSTAGSEKLSLNRIGHLILRYDSEKGVPSSIELNAAASISGYSSQYADDSVGNPPVDYSKYNRIHMNSGMMFSILGVEENGLDVSIIEGPTVLESDDNDYYGAFAIGSINLDGVPVISEDTAAFYVRDGSSYIRSQSVDYAYQIESEGKEHNVVFRVWYLSGSYKVEDTVILQDKADAESIEGTSSIKIPKLMTTSTVAYAGYYLNSDTPGSMNLVNSLSGSNPGTDFLVNVGSSDGGGLAFNQGAGLILGFDDNPSTAGTGVVLKTTISSNSGFLTSGYVGTITIHLAEISGGIAINVFDVEISVYLRLAEGENVSITHDILMRGDGNVSGSTDIYLPVLGENKTGEYFITSVTIGGDLTVTPTKTNLNKDGWLYTDFHSLSYSDDSSESLYIGVGGVYAPVLRMDYTLKENAEGTFEKAEIIIKMREEGSSAFTHTYTITLKPIKVTTVSITFMDTYLDMNNQDGDAWADYSRLFGIELEYGLTLYDTYVAINDSVWSDTGDVEFIQSVEGSFYKTTDGTVASGTKGYMESIAGDQTSYDIVPIPEALQMIVGGKPVTEYDSGTGKLEFNYSQHSPAWYENSLRLSEVNFGSKFTSDLQIFVGYSIVINTIGAYEEDGEYKTVQIRPDVIFPGAPGKTVKLNEINFTIPIGYIGTAWYLIPEDGSDPTIINNGELQVFSNARVCLLLTEVEYDLEVVFHYKTSTVDPTFELTVNGTTSLVHTFNYGDELSISSIDLANTAASNAHTSSASGTVENGGGCSISINGNVLSFIGPSGNLTVDVYLSDNYTVTVVMPSEDNSDNDRFTLDASGYTLGVSQYTSGGRSDMVVLEAGPGGITISLNTDGLSYYGYDVVFNLYRNGTLVSDQYDSDCTISTGTLGSDIEYQLYVYVAWEVQLGTGYTATIDSGSGTSMNLADGEIVYTGSQITLTISGDYQFGSTFATKGVSLITGDEVIRVYKVVGNQDEVLFGDASTRSFSVTIVMIFNNPAPDNHVGSFSLSDASGELHGDENWSKPYLTYSYRLTSGAYTWNADFEGFIEAQGSITVSQDVSVQVELQPITYNLEFYDSEGTNRIGYASGNWNTMVGENIDVICSELSGKAWGVYSTMWDSAIGGRAGTDSLTYSDYGVNDTVTKTLYLREIPGLSDIVPEGDVLVVVTESSSINGIHTVDGLDDIIDFDLSFRTSVDGRTVTITCYDDGRVLIQNCPVGTGCIVLELSRGFTLVIVSLGSPGEVR